jgi:hypothetical protein
MPRSPYRGFWEDLLMTKEEVVASIRLIKRWCRGKPVHSPEETKNLTAEYDAATTLEQKVAMKEQLEDKFKLPHQPVADANEAFNRTFPLIHAYNDTLGKGVCGDDTNEAIIASGLFDGEDHEIPCPKCGSPILFSTPVAEG